MADRDPQIAAKPGEDRSEGISWAELIATDSRTPPAFLTDESYTFRGSDPIPAERYTSEEFAQLERERMWPYVWQFVGREEDLPDPGDYIVYENAGRSYLVVRQDDGSIRAMHNVCLHRGRKLRTYDGVVDGKFVCPFPGFAWNSDGSFNSMPCQWDFPHLKPDEMSLPDAETGRWAGYVFIREEKGGPSLEEFLAPLPEFFKRWRHEECASVMRVAKEVPANWRVTMEAFMEAWHTIVTHPQLLPFTGDSNGAYWTWGDNLNANLVPFGVTSPHITEGCPERRPTRASWKCACWRASPRASRSRAARRCTFSPSTRSGPRHRNWASWATCLNRTWTICRSCSRACTLPRRARSSWAIIRKSAFASSMTP